MWKIKSIRSERKYFYESAPKVSEISTTDNAVLLRMHIENVVHTQYICSISQTDVHNVVGGSNNKSKKVTTHVHIYQSVQINQYVFQSINCHFTIYYSVCFVHICDIYERSTQENHFLGWRIFEMCMPGSRFVLFRLSLDNIKQCIQFVVVFYYENAFNKSLRSI